jgi:hypothetical protein
VESGKIMRAARIALLASCATAALLAAPARADDYVIDTPVSTTNGGFTIDGGDSLTVRHQRLLRHGALHAPTVSGGRAVAPPSTKTTRRHRPFHRHLEQISFKLNRLSAEILCAGEEREATRCKHR